MLIGRSLQQKFIIAAFAAVLLLTTVLGLLAAMMTRQALYGATEKQGRILAQTVSALIINELIYEKLGLVEEGGLIDNYMRELYRHPELDLLFVAVLDETLRVISHNDFSEFGKIYRTELIEQAVDSGAVQMARSAGKDHRPAHFTFAAPLSIEGKRWGVLLFALSLQEVEEKVTAILLQIISLSLAVLVVLFILIHSLSRRFIKPIIDLSQALAEVDVEMGERTVPVAGSDEMAHLATSYNAMVRRIRAANEATKLAHEQLRHSEKLATLGVLSSSVAHRINNPLGGLFNCVQLLRRKGDDPGFRKSYLDLVEEGLSSIEKTVSQLLRSASRHAGEEKRAEVALVVKNVLKFLDYRLSKQAISYEEHLEPDVKLAMPPRDLEEILMCTALNAIQAMATGGTLTITGRRHRGQVEISIADSGIGIASEQLPRVFELFYSTKPAGEGTGLGMWMVYELVKKHQGEIAIVSEPGRGTTVRFTIAEER